jgi:hypothetical protein
MRAEQIVESAGQQTLNVLTCDGLHHPKASLEIGVKVSPNMDLARPARRDSAALDLPLRPHRKRGHPPTAGFLKLPLDVRHSRHATLCFTVQQFTPASFAAPIP